jgi:methylmalonyl-CoA/ethylmalonyl-CoA epimerase
VTLLRRLDHVAVLVRDTDEALRFYHERLGLPLHSTEEIEEPHVRLTYLDAGNAYLQLVEPLDPDSPLAAELDVEGGLHHVCFGVDDVPEAVASLSDPGAPIVLGSGRGRRSGFISNAEANGVRIECTEFVRGEDVAATSGWPPDGSR